MKKLCAIFAAIMTAATVWIFCSCGSDALENVSERRSGYYTASDGVMTVTAVSGVRESPYAIDGKANALKPYTLITVVPEKFDVDAVYTYTATVGSSAYGGALIVHPFAASFSAEFDAEATGESMTVTITTAGESREYVLQSLVTSDMFDHARAIDAAKTAIDPQGKYEIRVRMIKNPLADGVCWHVAFYTADGSTSGVLLDPVTAKVLAKKTS